MSAEKCTYLPARSPALGSAMARKSESDAEGAKETTTKERKSLARRTKGDTMLAIKSEGEKESWRNSAPMYTYICMLARGYRLQELADTLAPPTYFIHAR